MKSSLTIAMAVMAAMFVAAPWIINAAPYESTMGLVQKIFYFHFPAAIIFLIAAIVSGVYSGLYLFGRKPASDWTALLADAMILVAVGLGLLFSPAYLARYGVVHVGEYYALLLLAALGMMLMAAATNLMVVFVGLEVLSLALYILCAMLPGRERSQEAAPPTRSASACF